MNLTELLTNEDELDAITWATAMKSANDICRGAYGSLYEKAIAPMRKTIAEQAVSTGVTPVEAVVAGLRTSEARGELTMRIALLTLSACYDLKIVKQG